MKEDCKNTTFYASIDAKAIKEDFKDTTKYASIDAQAIVFILKNNLTKDNYFGSNPKIKEILREMKSPLRDEQHKLFEQKKKYYMVEKKDELKKWSKIGVKSFDIKQCILDIKNHHFHQSENVNEYITRLSSEEKALGGKVMPKYSLWYKILWFLPTNAIYILFNHYEKLTEKYIKSKNKFMKNHGNLWSGLDLLIKYENENNITNVLDVTAMNDTKYICDQLLPLIEEKIDVILPITSNIPDEIIFQPNQMLEKEISKIETADDWEDYEW